jgi:hypothetical protein
MPTLGDNGVGYESDDENKAVIMDEGDLDDPYVFNGGGAINIEKQTFKAVIEKISECGMEYKNGKYDMDDKTRLVPGNEKAQGIILNLINNGENISKIDLDKIIDNDPEKVIYLLNLFNERKK